MASVYILGDSHTQVLGPLLRSRLIGRKLNTITFESFSGQPTASAHKKALIPVDQDVVVLVLGGNDRGDQTVARKSLIADVRLRNPKAKILWFGPFDSREFSVGERHDEQAEAQRAQLPDLGVQWVDTRPFSRSGHTADKVHFTGNGYTEISESMLPDIKRALASDESVGLFGLLLLAASAGTLWWLSRRKAS